MSKKNDSCPVLPNTLSGLLKVAVKDSLKVSKLKNFTLNMSVWLGFKSSFTLITTPCFACMAGSVMKNTLRLSPRRGNVIGPSSAANYEDRGRLFAINSMREGDFRYAYCTDMGKFDATFTASQNDAMLAASKLIKADFDYDRDGGRAKWRTYLKAAKMLEAVGL